MKLFDEIISNIWVIRTFWSVITILISVVVYNAIARVLNRHEEKKTKLFAHKKGRTFAKMFKSITRYVLIILDTLIILEIFGIDVSSMLAAAGIASVVIAFAIQDALKDVIRGFDIVSDNYYNVGDVVRIGTIEGKVLAIGLKTTKLQDINTQNQVSIANRDITTVEVMSDLIDLDIPFPYEVSLAQAEAVISEIVTTLKEQDNITNAEYRKVSNFSPSSMDYRIKVYGLPSLRPQLRRDALHVIAETLAKHKISIPYPQLDLHTKKN